MKPGLPAAERRLLESARTATLATIAPDGHSRLVPVCFVVIGVSVYTPIDEKQKSMADPRSLARVRDIQQRPDVTLLAERWSEDWSELAWVRVEGSGEIVAPEVAPREVIEQLRAKYPQYVDHDLEHRPMIAITIQRVTSWSAAEPS